MSDVKIECRPNGPAIIQGNVELTDAQGNKVVTGETTALCRCGFSDKKPLCDGSHKREGWQG